MKLPPKLYRVLDQFKSQQPGIETAFAEAYRHLDREGILASLNSAIDWKQPPSAFFQQSLLSLLIKIINIDRTAAPQELAIVFQVVNTLKLMPQHLDATVFDNLNLPQAQANIKAMQQKFQQLDGTNYVLAPAILGVYLQTVPSAEDRFYEAYDQLRRFYFQLANFIIKADGRLSPEEKAFLQKLNEEIFTLQQLKSDQAGNTDASTSAPSATATTNQPAAATKPAATSESPQKGLDELLGELNEYIGLEGVKNEVQQLINLIRVQEARKKTGMPVNNASRHLVFYGNPGTGKTMIARLLSRIFKALGTLDKGHLVEVDRSGLVGGFIGQTAIKVKKVVDEAMGGVLFIDEAYSLAGKGDQDYGNEGH